MFAEVNRSAISVPAKVKNFRISRKVVSGLTKKVSGLTVSRLRKFAGDHLCV
jgi:hypothetical protein